MNLRRIRDYVKKNPGDPEAFGSKTMKFALDAIDKLNRKVKLLQAIKCPEISRGNCPPIKCVELVQTYNEKIKMKKLLKKVLDLMLYSTRNNHNCVYRKLAKEIEKTLEGITK